MAYDDYYDTDENIGSTPGRSIFGGIQGATGGAITGSMIGGPVGALIGGGVGLLGGLFGSSPSKEEQIDVQHKQLALKQLRDMLSAQRAMNKTANYPNQATLSMLNPVTGVHKATAAQLFPGQGGAPPQGTTFDMSDYFSRARGMPPPAAPAQAPAAQPAEPAPYSQPFTPPIHRAATATDEEALRAIQGMRKR